MKNMGSTNNPRPQSNTPGWNMASNRGDVSELTILAIHQTDHLALSDVRPMPGLAAAAGLRRSDRRRLGADMNVHAPFLHRVQPLLLTGRTRRRVPGVEVALHPLPVVAVRLDPPLPPQTTTRQPLTGVWARQGGNGVVVTSDVTVFERPSSRVVSGGTSAPW